MRIAYQLTWHHGAESGVFKKLAAQTAYWVEQGARVGVFLLSKRPTYNEWRAALHPKVELFQQVWVNTPHRFVAANQWVNTILAWGPDIVYSRYDIYYPFLERIFRRHVSVYEINTNELLETRLGPKLRHYYRKLTRARLLSQTDGIVSVSREIINHSDFARFKQPSVVIGNGITLADFPELPPPNNSVPRLVLMGGIEHSWNGIDKALWLGRHFPTWEIDLIGVYPHELPADTPPTIHAHGKLTRDAYEPIMAQADIGLGTLALHRKQMQETSALKFTEYLAYGLPTIIAYTETHYPNGVPDFVLQIPNTEDNVQQNAAAIADFVETWHGQRVPRSALGQLDISATETRRLAFFQQLLDKAAHIAAQ